jgi:hypothetical protein
LSNVPSGPIRRHFSCASACVSATSPRLRTPCIATGKVPKPETSSSEECPAAPGGTSGRYGTRGRKPLLSIYPSQLLFSAGVPLALSSATLLPQITPQICRYRHGKLIRQRLARSAFSQRTRKADRSLKTGIGTILSPNVVSRAEKWAQSLTMNQKRR